MSIDYRYNAQERVKLAVNTPDDGEAAVIAQIAQAEATLALVEQLRIANLIALAGIGPQWEQDALHENVQADPEAKFPIWKLRDDIREGLGL